MKPVVAIDLGYSATKIMFDSPDGPVRAIVPSLVCPATEIRNETEAERAKQETVTVDGKDYFVGDTARLQGKAMIQDTATDGWIYTVEHRALLAFAANLAERHNGTRDCIYVLGLPVVFFESKRNDLKEVARTVLGNDAEIYVMAQPDAVYLHHMTDLDGRPRANRDPMNEAWAVVEVGHFSTDYVLYVEGRFIGAGDGGCEGSVMAIRTLQKRLREGHGIERNLIDCEKAYRTGVLMRQGQKINIEADIQEAAGQLAKRIVQYTADLFSQYIDDLNGILVAGGGAAGVYPALKSVWNHAIMVEGETEIPLVYGSSQPSSRFIVADGYYRFGRQRNLLNQSEQVEADTATA